MVKKNNSLQLYIAVQIFLLLFIFVSLAVIKRKENLYQSKPAALILAIKQEQFADDISAGCLRMMNHSNNLRDYEMAEVYTKIGEWKESQKELHEHIVESELDVHQKEIALKEEMLSQKYQHKIIISVKVLLQKMNAFSISRNFNELILKNEHEYTKCMNNIKNIYTTYDHAELDSYHLKEQILFALVIVIAIFNVVVLLTPLRKHILKI